MGAQWESIEIYCLYGKGEDAASVGIMYLGPMARMQLLGSVGGRIEGLHQAHSFEVLFLGDRNLPRDPNSAFNTQLYLGS